MTTMIADATSAVRRVADLRPNPLNPRGLISDESVADLVASVRAQGVIAPLLITPNGTVVAGHRRLRAAQIAGLPRVPVVVRELDKGEQLILMLAENLQRQDLTPLQEARAFERLVGLGLNHHEIARQVGVHAGQVRDRLCILRVDARVQEMFGRRELPITAARPLSHVTDPVEQRRLAVRLATRRMTTQQLEEVVAHLTRAESARPTVRAVEPQPEPKGPTWAGRQEAIGLLKYNPTRTFTLADLLRVFEGACSVCRECGLADLETACRECPGPSMVRRLLR